MAGYQTPFMGQFIQSSISDVADPFIAGLKDRQKSEVLSKLPKGPDGKLDYDAAIDYLIRNNQTDVAAKIAPIVTAQMQGGGVYGNPIYSQGPDGSVNLHAMGKRGGLMPMNAPPGHRFMLPQTNLNVGDAFVPAPTRGPVGPAPAPVAPPSVTGGRPQARQPGFAPAAPFDPAYDSITPAEAARANAPQPGSAAPIQPTQVPTQSIQQPAPGIAPGRIPINVQGREAAEERGKRQGAAQAAFPQIVSSAGTSMRLIDEALKHPGRRTFTGLSGTFDPRNYIRGTDAKNYEARHKQLEGRVFLDAFDQLRGGGAITEAEGNKATAAHARLMAAQSDEEYENSLKELRGILAKGVRVARLKAQGKWEEAERELGLAPPDVEVTAPGQPSIDDLVKKWAR